MNRSRILLGALAALTLAACQDTTAPVVDDDAPAPSLSVQQEAERVFPGRVLARLSDGADPAAVGQAHGVAFERTIASGRVSVFRGAVGNERALAARMGDDARVVYAEPDYLRQTTAIDPRMWAFYNPGGLSVDYTRGRNSGSPVTGYLSVEDADIDNMEGIGAGGAPVSIASIDTGVEMDHLEFSSATIEPGYDFYSGDADPSDTDDHGTHTTGTMVGNTVGVAGVAGAAGQVTVHVYRVCGPLGCPLSAIVDAIYAATDAGVVAMNLSLGGGSLAQSEADAIAYATANDALVIAAAGNDGTGSVSCPACDPNAISVAATDWLDQHAYYTNWGPGLDLSAPGGELYSNTTSESGIYSSVRGGYAYFQGTSMATPQVTGAAAVVASVRGLRGSALRSALESSADDLGAPGYDTDFGNGRLNLAAALNADPGDPPPPPPPPPTSLAASFTYSCDRQVCDFDGSGSTGSVTSWDWTFGDGGSDSGARVTHAYSTEGSFTVTLTVSDGASSDEASATLTCQTRGPWLRCG